MPKARRMHASLELGRARRRRRRRRLLLVVLHRDLLAARLGLLAALKDVRLGLGPVVVVVGLVVVAVTGGGGAGRA